MADVWAVVAKEENLDVKGGVRHVFEWSNGHESE